MAAGRRLRSRVERVPTMPQPLPPPVAGSESAVSLPVQILAQPDDETCGPTCLHAVYRYWGDGSSLEQVVKSTAMLNGTGAGRGTLAVMLGVDALRRGYRTTLYTFNLEMFDPTWFDAHGKAEATTLAEKLRGQYAAKADADRRLAFATEAYLEFLGCGGTIGFADLTSKLIARLIRSGRPVLTGLSATYLYRCAREWGPNDDYDDLRGLPTGHFVVLHGYDPHGRRVEVADPLADNPGYATQRYSVSISRLVPAIMLGVLTHDANLLIIEPADDADRHP